MLTYPVIDPVAVALGPVKVHWYGLMYLLGFAAAWWLAMRRSQRPWAPVRRAQVDDLIVYAALGVVIGGRLGSGLFYNFDIWRADPLWIFRIWEGGMAFHGGLLGVLTALWLFGRKLQQPFLAVADFVAPLVPIGLGLGRIGNFIGQELWGRPTDLPWAMVFPRDPEQLARHPSQLYQALLEGLVLFALLFWFSRRQRPTGAVGGLFLTLYGLFRFLVEFVREPDRNIGFDLFDWLTRGQLLSLPMILAGLLLIGWAYGSARQRTQR
ncbi:MAG: prolipoprotein diacylglyceryl transferase [Gammaproteobacteria bacterium]|nr:prolipoprotein diacylglyceryl transferase [Gammaproteobacteria bacterium]